jgi:hypothetical protein
VYREQRPTRTQTYSAPPTTTTAPQVHTPPPQVHTSPPPPPAHTSQPAPAPQKSEPSRNARPERKSDTDNKPHSQLGYPRPYGETVRPATFTSSAVPRPIGPVASTPRVHQASYSVDGHHSAAGSSVPATQSKPSTRSFNGSAGRGSQSHSSSVSSRSASHSSSGNIHARH